MFTLRQLGQNLTASLAVIVIKSGTALFVVVPPDYQFVSFSLLVFYVTWNDISVIYVTAQMCRRTEEEVVPTVKLQTP